MKLLIIALIGFIGLSNPTNEIETKTVNVDNSTVVWTGKKVTGSHEGTVGIKEGTLNFDNNALTGGMITIDMSSLTCTDLEGGMNAKLVGHLSSPDFFDVANHPTAALNITSATKNEDGSYSIVADLTIKSITNPISFEADITENTAKSTLKIDRTKYDVKYGSGSFFENLGDKTIYDHFDLEVMLSF